MLKAVLFDLDGTLLDTAADFTRVLNSLLSEHGLPPQHYDAVRRRVSDGARAVVNLGFTLTPEDPAFDGLLTAFLDRYEQALSEQTSLFPGMDEQLQALEARHIAWGIVTNKPERFTVPLLRQIGLSERCATAICPDHVRERKPAAEPILLACSQLGIDASEAVYVGDHRRDIEAGRNAHMPTIACRYGYISEGEQPEDWNPDRIINTPQELLSALRDLKLLED